MSIKLTLSSSITSDVIEFNDIEDNSDNNNDWFTFLKKVTDSVLEMQEREIKKLMEEIK